MRNTRQGTSVQEENDNITMQKLMETICTFHQTMAASKADQEKVLAEVRGE